MKVNTLIWIIIIVILGLSIYDRVSYEPTYEERNITYQVKEVHFGTSDNIQFMKIFYYCNNQILTITSNNVNQIDIYRTPGDSKLIWIDECVNYDNTYNIAANHFDLYISDNMCFDGENSVWTTTWSNGKISGTRHHSSTMS